MKAGDKVRILSGKDAGRVGHIYYVYPGAPAGRWPYYFRVRVSSGVIDATINRLEIIECRECPGPAPLTVSLGENVSPHAKVVALDTQQSAGAACVIDLSRAPFLAEVLLGVRNRE